MNLHFISHWSRYLALPAIALLISSCSKAPEEPPVPEGISAVRIKAPANRRIFFGIDYDKVEGSSFSSNTISGDQRMTPDGEPYVIPLDKYDPNSHTGIRIRVYGAFAEPFTVKVLAESGLVESKTSAGNGGDLEFKYGSLNANPKPAFDHLAPSATQEQLISDLVAAAGDGSADAWAKIGATDYFSKFGTLGGQVLSAGLKDQLGQVTPSTQKWVYVSRGKGKGFLEGEILAGETPVVLFAGLDGDKVDSLKYLPPKEGFTLPAFAAGVLEENSREFLTHFFKQERAEVEAMTGFKKQLTPEYLDRLTQGTQGYWKEGETLDSKGLYLVKEMEGETHLASVFEVAADKSTHPHPQVWYAHYHSRPKTNWESVEFFMINLVFTSDLKNLQDPIGK